MFVIVTYDVNAKRDPKVMKTLRKHLTHEQRSVFEGLITPGRLKHLKEELKRIVDVSEDCINIYCLETLRYSKKESIGKQVYHGNILSAMMRNTNHLNTTSRSIDLLLFFMYESYRIKKSVDLFCYFQICNYIFIL